MTARPADPAPADPASIGPPFPDQRRDLLLGYHVLDRAGLGSGIAGHLTARDADDPSLFRGHPYGHGFEEVREDDLILVDRTLRPVRGTRRVSPSLSLHAAIYAARPDVGAVVHTHGARSIALGAAGACLEPVFQSALVFFEDCALFDEYGGIIEDEASSARIVEALGPRRALMLKNHGLLVVGATVREAVAGAILFEQGAEIQLLAMAAGRIDRVPDEAARQAKSFLLSPLVRDLRWDHLCRRVVAERPFLAAEGA